MKKLIKEEITAGVFLPIFLSIFVLLLLFSWSPVSYYLSGWNEYWSEEEQSIHDYKVATSSISIGSGCKIKKNME